MNLQDKILIFRLSSLGDIVLATSIFESFPSEIQVDWVVKREFAGFFEGHPRIRKLWVYDSKTGLKGWLQLISTLKNEHYTCVLDLHRSLRTTLARLMFMSVPWKRIKKERIRTTGLFLCKKMWPRQWLPTSWHLRFRRTADFLLSETYDHFVLTKNESHLVLNASSSKIQIDAATYCVLMPSSAWASKEWPVENWVRLLRELNVHVVVLGTQKDRASRELSLALRQAGLSFTDGVGRWSLSETAYVISKAKYFVGVDTGLAHLAESLEVPTFVFFGPTHPDAGFAPRLKASRTFGSTVWCRPCGKSGKYCHRISKRYICINDAIENQKILSEMKDAIQNLGKTHE